MSEHRTADGPNYSGLYVGYVVVLLFLLNVLNTTDRLILATVLEPIRQEFDLSDLELGLLGGLAFALVFSTVGLPIARLADRTVRRVVIAASVIFWSVSTWACGFATSYTHLLLGRFGVAAGESGFSPTSHSVISDYVSPARRALAFSIYTLAGPVGIFVGNAAGGWLAEAFDWRMAFFGLGLPGVALGIVVLLTVKEPERGHSDRRAGIVVEGPQKGEVLRLLKNPAFAFTVIGSATHLFVTYGILNFLPSFFVRLHGMGLKETGLWLGTISAIAGGASVLIFGWLADRLAQKRGRHWYAIVPAVTVVLTIPCALLLYLAGGKTAALVGLTLMAFFNSGYQAPRIALAQLIAPLHARATASSIMILAENLIGLGLGPPIVGLISDLLAPSLQEDSLRWALVLTFFVNIVSGLAFWLAARKLKQDAPKA
ncbi:MAG: MFS transporter [Alphaproteobacteria bacterium]|nr:MFS transporter [Alphaproteobacteria bacterium]